MKQWIPLLIAWSLILLLFLTYPSGSTPIFFGLNYTAAAGGCATIDTLLAHDELLEGWEGDGTELTWTAGQSADSVTLTTGFNSASLTTNKPAGACDKALEVALNATTAGEKHLRWDRGSIIGVSTAADLNFYIYITSALDSGERVAIASCGESTSSNTSVCAYVTLFNDTGTSQLRIDSGTTSTYVNLTASQWNKVTVHFDTVAALSSLAVNNGTPVTFTRSASRGIQYVFFGACDEKAAGDAVTYVVDVVCLNTP